MILVDSDVLIAHLRGLDVAQNWLVEARRRTGPLAVSAVSVAEILGGMRSGERREVTRLLTSLNTLTVDDAVARQAGDFRRRYRRSHNAIGIADYLIAATAVANGCELSTLNVKHFPMFEGIVAPFSVQHR